MEQMAFFLFRKLYQVEHKPLQVRNVDMIRHSVNPLNLSEHRVLDRPNPSKTASALFPYRFRHPGLQLLRFFQMIIDRRQHIDSVMAHIAVFRRICFPLERRDSFLVILHH